MPLKIKSLDLFVALVALAAGCLIGYAHLHLFPSELNPNLVIQPSLIDRGFVLYRHLGDQKPPLLLLSVAWLLPLFQGDAVTAARTLHFIIIVLVVFLSIAWIYRGAGVGAAFFSGLFILAWSPFLGLWATAYYDLVVSLFFLLFFMLITWDAPGRHHFRAVAGGLLVGIAALVKQTALILGLIFTADLAVKALQAQISLKKALILLAVFLGSMLAPAIIYLALSEIQHGSAADIVFWNFLLLIQNNFAALGKMAIPTAQFVRIIQVLILLVPFSAAIFIPGLSENLSPRSRIWLLVFLAAAASFQFPRYSGRHWAVVLPFAAIISGVACQDVLNMVKRRGIYLAAAIFLVAPAWWAFRAVDQYISAFVQPNPMIGEYSDLIQLADELEEILPVSGSMAIFPTDESNANLHYLLKRDPPHYFIYHYPWFMNNNLIKQRWINALESERTPVIINFPPGWNVEVFAPELITYIQEHYQLIDTVEWKGQPVQIMLRKPDRITLGTK